MKKTLTVTLLVVLVVSLVSFISDKAAAAAATTNKVIMSADQKVKEPTLVEPTELHFAFQVARNTSLYDHQDGTRKDGIDYLMIPAITTSFGSFSAKVAYSQDLKDESTDASDWADIPVTYAMKANKWEWAPPYILTLIPTLTMVAPASQKTIKRDQLQTSIITGVSFGIIPDEISFKKDGVWNLALGLTAGQNFHSYSTDINGSVLNKYSSNQTLNLGYTYKQYSFNIEYINKIRWTYQNNTKSTFEHTEELGYSLNENFSVAVGHTNAGSALKTNGSESNIDLINENDSVIYTSLSVAF